MEHTEEFRQHRRFLMVVPLLVLPFVAMIFWALGGGKGIQQQPERPQAGINMTLPGVNYSKVDGNMNKLSIYEQAKLDSQKYEQDKRLDPYFQFATLEQASGKDEKKESKLLGSKPKDPLQLHDTGKGPLDENEAAVREKLRQLTRHLQRSSAPPANEPSSVDTLLMPTTLGTSSEVDRLEALMENLQEDSGSDEEMREISQVLDKILDIQHPERVKERLKGIQENEQKNAKRVEAAGKADYQTLLSTEPVAPVNDSLLYASQENNAFYTLDEFAIADGSTNAIEALIQGEQTIVSGGIVKLRLLSDLLIQKNTIPAGAFVYGICTVNGERLKIDIKSVAHHSSIYPVSLKVYDLDGQEGLFVPGAITRDAAKNASGQMFQDMQLYSMDPSLAAQAASAGVQAATGLMSKKAKLVKFTVKSGYRVFLRDSRSTSQNI
jgi:conjugative transposon TraM protein